ncbi:MAG: magnesium and cobalt transport protein CorA [Gordonia sp. (in: high G+C Gram-positive bacteria)]
MPGLPGLHGAQPAPPLPPVPATRAVVDCGVYVDGVRQPGFTDYRTALEEVRRTGRGFVWMGLHAPTEDQMNSVGETFGLHSLLIEDAVHAHQRPKLELYDGIMLVVLRSIKYVDHDDLEKANDIVDVGEIQIMAGDDFVITVRHGDHTQLAGVRQNLEAHPELLALGPASVVHAIADHVVDRYQEVALEMESDVDEIEERTFASPSSKMDIDVVYLFKREILQMRRAVLPLAVPLAWLADDDDESTDDDPSPIRAEKTGSFSEKEIRRHFRDVSDHLKQTVDLVTEYDERLSSLIDAAATKVSIQQNTDMRKISAWAAVAAVPTAVAGIYGMNFDYMPELHWHWSYPVLLVLLLVACITLWRVLHRNHWL